MELPEQEDGRIISMALIAIVLALVLLLLARCIKYLFFFIAGRLKRIIPPRITNVISAVIVVVIVVTLCTGAMRRPKGLRCIFKDAENLRPLS